MSLLNSVSACSFCIYPGLRLKIINPFYDYSAGEMGYYDYFVRQIPYITDISLGCVSAASDWLTKQVCFGRNNNDKLYMII